jgi:RNA polymerase sigma factor (sigma-70 family)
MIVRQLRQIVKGEPLAPLSDGHLLERFAAEGDESALAALIERHGPMVLSVGRRVLRDWHEAEDVFQAAFLVLARRAGRLDRRGSLAPWLHTVAFRLALRARRQSSRWRRSSGPVDDVAMTTNDPEAARELRSVLDEELERLPVKYRAPLVLCYLEGKTVTEAAEHLGWPRGTVGGRLARAKDLMRQRLTRRGVTPGAAFLGPALADQAPAALPAGLTASTVKAALSFAAGRASPGAAASTAALLAQGELRTMTQSRLAMTAAALLFLGAIGVGAVVLGQQALTQPPRDDAPKQAAEATPARLDANGDPLPPGALTRLGTVRFRHAQVVNVVGFTADDRVVASASKDGTLRLWEAATGKELRGFDVSPMTATFGLSADGQTVAAPVPAGDDRTTIRVWDAATGREAHRIEPGTAVSHVLLTADGRLLVWGDRLGIHLWDLKADEEARVLRTPEGLIRGLALSADGKTVAASGPDHAVRVWEAGTGKELCRVEGTPGTQVHMALSSDGQTLASRAENESDVRLWDVATRRQKVALITKNAMLSLGRDGKEIPAKFENAIAFSADGKYVATTISQVTGWSVVIWEVATGRRAKVAPIPTMGPSWPLSAVALSSDGRTLATGGLDNLVRVTKLTLGTGGGWDYAGPHVGPVRSIAVTPDGKTLGTGCDYSGIPLWDTAGRQIAWNLRPGNSLVFSPDGKVLASFTRGSLPGDDFRITLWEKPAGWDVREGPFQQILKEHTQRVGAVCFTADGKTLLSWGLDRTFRHWDVATAKEVRQAAVPAEDVYDVTFSRDGQMAAGAAKGPGKDSTVVYLWDPATGEEIHRWEVRGCVVDAMAYSSDGRTLAIAGRGEAATTIRLLNTGDGKETKQWTDPTHRQIPAVAFSPEGKTLASGSDRWLRLWDVATARQRAVYKGHQAPITSIAFTPDGKAVCTASEDSTALVWDLSTLTAK